ncbi:MAG: portal protein [Rhodobacteraceae bacterium]|nr:portal protein [Paracoccaceae bacterium]
MADDDNKVKIKGKGKIGSDVDLTSEPVPSDSMVNVREEMADESPWENENDRILKECVKNMDEASSYWRDLYDVGRQDLEFLYEEQWPDEAKIARQNRPMLTLNQLPQYIFGVVNQARRTKFDINVKQIAGKNLKMFDQETLNKPYTRSQIMEGLVRDIEYRSKAHDKYCTALQHSCESGLGWLRVNVRQFPDDPWNPEIRVECVKDRFSILYDPPDGRDADFDTARYVGQYWDMDIHEFKAKFGEHTSTTALPSHNRTGGQGRNRAGFWRQSKDTVRVCDYWWKEPMEREVLELVAVGPDGSPDRLILYRDAVKEVLDELRGYGYEITRRKKIMSHKVKFIRCVYNHILEGPLDWPSMHLPIVPVMGREIDLPEQCVYLSVHRQAHDSMRMVNYWYSAATEKMALSPKEPFLLTTEQIAGLQQYWEDQTVNRQYVLYNHEPDVPMPTRQAASGMAQGELQMLTATRQIMQDTMGIHDAQLGQKSNEVSGVALQERQEQGMTNTFDFIDNLSRSVVHVGEIVVDMIPRIYTGDIARQVILPDDTTIQIDLNRAIEDRQTGKVVKVNTLDYARFSCRVATGPSNATLREDFTTIMMEWGRTDPEGLSLVRDLLAANMDIPNSSAFAERFKAAVPRQLLSPEDQEKMPEPQPTIEQQIAQLQAQADMKKAEAEIIKAQAEVEKAKINMRSFQYRAEGDMAKRDSEIEKGLNKADEHAAKAALEGIGSANESMAASREMEAKDAELQQKGEEDLQRQVEALVKKAVAEALADKEK